MRCGGANMMGQILNSWNQGSAIAYVDGGTGSILLQAMLAGFLTCAYLLKTKFSRLRALFAKWTRGNEPLESHPED